MYFLYTIFAIVSFWFLIFPFLEVVLSRFTKVSQTPKPSKEVDFACIITAYKNVEITIPLVHSLLDQNYNRFAVYLVADACDTATWDIVNDRLVVLRPDPPLNLKAKSIIHAVEQFRRDHDYIVIFDADNLAHPNFLAEINKYANQGHKAIQGQRTAKNLNSLYACADATGEFYKNYIERYLPPLLGSSSVISGSGMAIERELYKDYLYGAEIQKGKERWKKMLQEDKILQNHILDRNERIVFAWHAVIYDEKVTTGQAAETQRSRWLYSYFQNIPNALRIIRKGVARFSFNQFWFGVITIAPPLFLQVLVALILIMLGFWIAPLWSFLLFLGLLIFSANVLLTLYLSNVPGEIWRALWGVPLFVFKQFTALFKMRDPNKHFKHSEHDQKVSIEDILGRKEGDAEK